MTPTRRPHDPPAQTQHPRRIVVGITGASGAAYAQRVIQGLLAAGVEVHLVVTPYGVRLLHDELGMAGIDRTMLAGDAGEAGGAERIIIHSVNDMGAAIASGSFVHDGMIVIPCSANALNTIAAGLGSNLLYRAAAVTLKERRKLILCHRETPLTIIDIQAMEKVTLAGAIVAPANPGYYFLPQSVDDLVDFMAARWLDLLGVEHTLGKRWGQEPADVPVRSA